MLMQALIGALLHLYMCEVGPVSEWKAIGDRQRGALFLSPIRYPRSPFISAFRHINGEACERGLFVGFTHVGAGAPHRFDDLIQAHVMRPVAV